MNYKNLGIRVFQNLNGGQPIKLTKMSNKKQKAVPSEKNKGSKNEIPHQCWNPRRILKVIHNALTTVEICISSFQAINREKKMRKDVKNVEVI